jgi:cyanophycinase
MKLKFSILLLISSISHLTVAKETNNGGQLFLVGGGLKTCSSMSIKNCNTKTLTKIEKLKEVKFNNLYQVNQKTLTYVQKNWPKRFNLQIKENILNVLKKSSKLESTKNLSLKELKSIFAKNDRKGIINKLSDPEYYSLLDLLEQPVVNGITKSRLKEYVELANSTNSFSTDIYQRFVAQAKSNSGKVKPDIIVLTPSARDPFEAADFYKTVFQQAGANSQWLPLDATLNELMQISGARKDICKNIAKTRAEIQGSLNRELVYPDLTNQQKQACLTPQIIIDAIALADGIFINGGDQSLTLKAFVNRDGSDSEILQLIKKKLLNQSFIIGGTSAGTAVMSGGVFYDLAIPMITNGLSNTALVRGAKKDMLPTEGCQKSNSCDTDLLNDDLTYNSTGGLGLFHWGVLDTHFSERGRQGRLAKLALETNTRFAFGVDEATALIVSNMNKNMPKMTVIGQGGVFIVENTPAKLMKSKKEAKNSVKTHYINFQDTATIKDGQLNINLASWKKGATENQIIPNNIEYIFSDDRYKKVTEVLCRTNNKQFHAIDSWDKHKINITVAKGSDAQDGYGVVVMNGLEKGYCSFKNYDFSFAIKE